MAGGQTLNCQLFTSGAHTITAGEVWCGAGKVLGK